MTDLSAFPITQKWPAQYPDWIQLYSLPTPNGVKVSIMLEEIGLPYEPHRVGFDTNDQTSAEFLSLNPNNKIPAILDPHGPEDKPLPLFESGAILIYLADKSGQLLAQEGALRYETIQWLMWQMGGIGPMFGQLGFFNKFAGKDYEDKRPRDRYVEESKRLLNVLNTRLEGRDWDHGRALHHRRYRHVPGGCAICSGFMRRGIWSGLRNFPNVTRVLGAVSCSPGGHSWPDHPILTFSCTHAPCGSWLASDEASTVNIIGD